MPSRRSSHVCQIFRPDPMKSSTIRGLIGKALQGMRDRDGEIFLLPTDLGKSTFPTATSIGAGEAVRLSCTEGIPSVPPRG